MAMKESQKPNTGIEHLIAGIFLFVFALAMWQLVPEIAAVWILITTLGGMEIGRYLEIKLSKGHRNEGKQKL